MVWDAITLITTSPLWPSLTLWYWEWNFMGYYVISAGCCSSLRWRHNEHDGVSSHQPQGCLLNRLFGRRSKKTSKLRVTGLCVGNSPGTAQMASNAENGSIWWRHHVHLQRWYKLCFTIACVRSGITCKIDFYVSYNQSISASKIRMFVLTNDEHCKRVFLVLVVYFLYIYHDDVIRWKHSPRYWPFGRELTGDTGHLWIPLTKASDAELWCFLWSAREQTDWVNNPDAGDLRRHRAHYDFTLIFSHMRII